ncbi:MAG TPA: site-2 protease family protein [Kineosporiaceae bacterium]|nr:site-2 protease family protein [Kineosporiaceae bacterium]
MAYLAGVLVIVVGVGLSIALHEIGHLVPAKRFGVKTTQYMVGFGPTVWSTKRGETEYGLKWIPLGGYIRMVGMFPPVPGRPVRADSTGRWSLMAEQARSESQREIGDVPNERLFYTKPVWQRLIIMLGGPTMNLVIAVVLLALIMVGYGMPEQTTQLSNVSQCVIPATAPVDQKCTPSDPAAPAAAAGLKPGDKIVSFANRPVSSWDQVRKAIAGAGGTTVTLGIERDGQRLNVQVSPVANVRYVTDEDGQAVLGSDGKRLTERVGFLGVTPITATVKQPITAVPAQLADYLGKTAGVVLRIPQKMVGVAQAAFGGAERDPNGPISIVGVSRVAGEVASADGPADVTTTTMDRFVSLLSLIMSLNLALFIFNLVPLLPLDGGHAAGAIWEGLRRQIAKVRRRPDPGPVDVARALPIAYGVASLLIVMSVVLIYADLVRPIKLGG